MNFISLLIYVSVLAWFESLHHSQAVADQLLLSEEKPSKLEQIELSSCSWGAEKWQRASNSHD
tara:strand:+ start:1150 stop:1338 length:189 start_codon:yes stop_codon:yes gene_type:complete